MSILVFFPESTINSTNLHRSFFGQDETNRLKAFSHWRRRKETIDIFSNLFAINKITDF